MAVVFRRLLFGRGHTARESQKADKAQRAAFLPSSVVDVLDLASRYLADHDGGADHVRGALFAFRASRHVGSPSFGLCS
jgi:hypothetical protein